MNLLFLLSSHTLHFLHNTLRPFSPFFFFFFNLTSFSVSLTFSVAAPLAAPSCEGLLLQDNAVSAEIRALLSSYYNDR